MKNNSAIVIGAGIAGLAHARALALKGFKVTVLERHPLAKGASIRNFGMVWPIGQPAGTLYERALRSRRTWKELCTAANIWHSEVGSLHVATHSLEAAAMQQVATAYASCRQTRWLTAQEMFELSPAANRQNTLGALWSPHEMIVESREAIRQLPVFLTEKYGMQFEFETAVTSVESHRVSSGSKCWQADLVVICNGDDFETLYPEQFAAAPITKCKLQMMRLAAQPNQWKLGPAICGGLSLTHYKSFEVAEILPTLSKWYQHHMPDYLQWGIHVMACQNHLGEITIGDTHEYGLHLDPFDKAWLNDLVLQYLKQFTQLPDYTVVQSWNGTYTKMTNGETEWIQQLNNHTLVVNGLGGAGMTLSFGLAEEVVDRL